MEIAAEKRRSGILAAPEPGGPRGSPPRRRKRNCPSGRLLDEAMEEAGIDRKSTYVTNAVKHFKWEARGKRRIHQKPNAREIAACKPWLAAELAAVRPAVVVALGATAARALLGPSFRVTRERGKIVESAEFGRVIATVHPSSILRAPDESGRRKERKRFVANLKRVARALKSSTGR